jgi:ribonuclease P protein component
VNLDVRILTSPLPHPRVGLVVPNYNHSAVARNRLKRQLRELVRLRLLPTMRERQPVDVAIRARPNAYSAPRDALLADISTACKAL